jgi:hypothetical protein
MFSGRIMMVIRSCRFLLCMFGLAIGSFSASSQSLIRVYVQAGSGDFAANGAGDSALDLRKALLGKSRTLQVVDTASESDIVVRIDSRNERKETSSVTTYANQSNNGKSATATTVPSTRTIDELHATIVVADSQIPLETESALSWRLAASDMASSVDHWVKENYARLIERRVQQKNPTAPEPAPGPSEAKSPVSSQTNSDASTQDISVTPGMSESQVLSSMGAPDKKVTFGKKSMWNYRGMQIVFEDGKVTDVKF